MTRDDFFIEPQLVKVEYGPEPCLFQFVKDYYIRHGISQLGADKLAEEYMAALIEATEP